jgi:hypothetical protein
MRQKVSGEGGMGESLKGKDREDEQQRRITDVFEGLNCQATASARP